MQAPRALARGLAALQLIAHRPLGLTFGDLASELDLNHNSLSRLLGGLIALDYLVHGEDGRYRRGSALDRLGPVEERRGETLLRLGAPMLRELRQSSGCSAALLGWTGDSWVGLANDLEPDGVVLQPPGYTASNIRQTPWGWFCMPRSFWRRETVANHPRRTMATHNARRVPLGLIRSELDRLDRDGFTVDSGGERRRLAAPIRGADAELFGALAIAGSAGTLSDQRIEGVGRHVAARARSLSHLLR